MSETRRERPPWTADCVNVGLAYGAAATLSALQISLRRGLDGASSPLSEQLILNFIAWLPWLPIALVVFRRSRRPQPKKKKRRFSTILRHTLSAHCVATLFLIYLTLFRFLFFDESADWTLPGFFRQIAVETGDFYFACILLYGLCVAATQALRSSPATTPAPVEGLLEGELLAAAAPPVALAVRSTGRSEFVPIAEIDWVQADGSYARLHLRNRRLLIRRSLKNLLTELEPAGFVRIHRSSLVKVARAVELRPLGHGDATLRLQDGTELRVSRTYRAQLSRLLAPNQGSGSQQAESG